MNYKKYYLIVLMLVLLSGCVEPSKDLKLQNYSETIISMELNHAKTASFCQENGYSTSHQWIVGDEHSGFYGQKIGYDIYGMNGGFNANDARVHVDCIGTSIEEDNYSIQDVNNWLKSIEISNEVVLKNSTYDYFCNQKNMNFLKNNSNYVTCHRSYEVIREYTPQEIARWYILK